MKLKRLFIFRHGPYEGRGFLTPQGSEQMKRLGEHLASTYGLTPGNTKVICSEELRTIKTAQALSLAAFKESDEEYHMELFSNDSVCDAETAAKVVLWYAQDWENVIVITHYEMTGELPFEFGKTTLGVELFQNRVDSYGCGYLIDCDKKEQTEIRIK